jgi:hypothetical protein
LHWETIKIHAPHNTTPHCTLLYCKILHHNPHEYNSVKLSAIQHNIVQYSAADRLTDRQTASYLTWIFVIDRSCSTFLRIAQQPAYSEVRSYTRGGKAELEKRKGKDYEGEDGKL